MAAHQPEYDFGIPARLGDTNPTRSQSLARLDTEEARAEYQRSKLHVELEGDLYTNAIVSALGLPSSTGEKSQPAYADMIVCVGKMLIVTLIQLLMSWAVYLHVQNQLIETKTRPLLTAFEMFVGTNITIPLGTVTQLCGQWEDQEMKGAVSGPLSVMTQPDGSVYSSDDSYSLFYNIKQPTRSWDYGRLGSERSVIDDVMFVISEGVTFNPCTPSGYSLLFMLTLSVFFFSIIVEYRRTIQFILMVLHFNKKHRSTEDTWLPVAGDAGPTSCTKFKIVHLTPVATSVGVLAILCRTIVATTLLVLGTLFLFHTSLKIDLLLNGLAILFLLELDMVIYLATVPASRQRFISDIESVSFPLAWAPAFISLTMFPLNFLLAVIVRAYQIHVFQKIFHMTAAICLFAGPTTPFARQDIIHPVAGFCDSLLGVTCAPHVDPEETARRHGYCIITDQTTMTSPTVQFYLDDPNLFDNRVDSDGTENSWVDWGNTNKKLFESEHWMDGPYQDLLRKNCLQIYQKTTKPDDVLVDDDAGETMDGAPFYCEREPLFRAIFGDVFDSVGNIPTEEAILKIKDLNDPDVIRAIDDCKIPAPSEKEAAKAKREAKKKKQEKAKAESSALYHELSQKADTKPIARHDSHHSVDRMQSDPDERKKNHHVSHSHLRPGSHHQHHEERVLHVYGT